MRRSMSPGNSRKRPRLDRADDQGGAFFVQAQEQMPSLRRGSGQGGGPGAGLQVVCDALVVSWACVDGVTVVAGSATRWADAAAFSGRKRARRFMLSRCV